MDSNQKNDQATKVLSRFGPQLRWTVKSVVMSFRLDYDKYEELRQEAEILVVTYAGLMDRPSWGNGRLAKWEERTGGNESQVKHLLAKQLREDLSQIVKRRLDREMQGASTLSLETLVDTDSEPVDEEWEYREVLRIDGEKDSERFYRKFPFLSSLVLDGYSQTEIAEMSGVTTRTIRNRLAAEKRAYLQDYLRRNGVRTEGNESNSDLMESTAFVMETNQRRGQ